MEVRASKRFRSTQEKREIVEETLRAGASVSVVARAHDVNANQVFRWRKLYREGQLEVDESTTRLRLLPVKVTDVAVQKMRVSAKPKAKFKSNGIIDIDLGHAGLRIEGAADPDCVRAALAGLIR
jgi:transposase